MKKKTRARNTQGRTRQGRKFTVEDSKGTVRMNNTAAVGNKAGQAADKDKDKVVEKRRALGRGLAALFAGPRMVAAPGTGSAGGSRPDLAAVVVPAENAAELRSAGQPGAAVPTQDLGQMGAGVPTQDLGQLRAAIPTQDLGQLRAGVPTQDLGQMGAAIPARDLVEMESTEPESGSMRGDAAAYPDVMSPALASGEVEYDAYEEGAPGETIEIQAVADRRIPTNLVVNVAIADVDKNPFQTRYVEDDDALEELAESIKANGVVQPIVVRPAEVEGRYILVMGERRLHASKKAGKTHIPALVRRVSEQQAAEMTIIENLQREDLSPLEQAEAFRVLSNQFKLTQEEIGERVGLSRVSVANYMRLLKLPREVMQMLAEKRINFAQAKELLKLDDNDRIAEAALYAVKKGMNIEQIEMLVLRMDGLLDPLPDMPGVKKKEAKASGARWVDPNVRAAQMDLERMLGVRVRIRDRKGHGKIVIEYSTV
ncbi:MAG TPA: ParB/RepB/Spo0J family partition protein, partial [Candidatus Sulfotelmatobacter sp.]|nr:ParB/RepB/Spo0J family partition protein [Candidatus Sulfotelmatobacter sp.]